MSESADSTATVRPVEPDFLVARTGLGDLTFLHVFILVWVFAMIRAFPSSINVKMNKP